jgi:hypothetical protein
VVSSYTFVLNGIDAGVGLLLALDPVVRPISGSSGPQAAPVPLKFGGGLPVLNTEGDWSESITSRHVQKSASPEGVQQMSADHLLRARRALRLASRPRYSPTVVTIYPGCAFVMVAAWRPPIIPKTMAGPIVDPGPG